MTKTEQQIERDVYMMLCESELGKKVKGHVYRSEMRPPNTSTEDVVVKFLTGLDEQIQTGIVIINIYVPDKPMSYGRKVINHKRIGELQSLAVDFVENNCSTEYNLSTDESMTTIKHDDIEQHIIVLRLRFNRLNI